MQLRASGLVIHRGHRRRPSRNRYCLQLGTSRRQHYRRVSDGLSTSWKNVELFRDMLPSARRVGVLGHSTNPVFAKAMLDEVLVASGPTGLEIQPVVMVRGPDEFGRALTTMAKEQADAVVVQGSLAVKSLTDMAIKYRLPMASTTRAFAEIAGPYVLLGRMGPLRSVTAPDSYRKF